MAKREPGRPGDPPRPARATSGAPARARTGPRRRGRAGLIAVVALAAVLLCFFGFVRRPSGPAGAAGAAVSRAVANKGDTTKGNTTKGSTTKSNATATPPATTCSSAVQLAFAGDVNTANAASRVLDHGLGDAGRVLARADEAMVNTETVLADDRTGLVAQPKEYNFVAPTRLLDVLHRAGVDVVTVANNHGEDYGLPGLRSTLAARSPSRPQLVGAGNDVAAAFAPARATVRGRGVVFFAATDVVDDGLDWSATATSPGLASIKTDAGLARLRAAVRQDRAAHPCDVISVYLHAGVELTVCPTARQRLLARDLAADGADVVLMSHAHVRQPGQVIGRTAVDYGLGNFVFAGHPGPTSQTGVLTVDVPRSGSPKEVWHPGRIVNGLPTMLTGAAARAAAHQWDALGADC